MVTVRPSTGSLVTRLRTFAARLGRVVRAAHSSGVPF